MANMKIYSARVLANNHFIFRFSGFGIAAIIW